MDARRVFTVVSMPALAVGRLVLAGWGLVFFFLVLPIIENLVEWLERRRGPWGGIRANRQG